jgi:hypothetical protein
MMEITNIASHQQLVSYATTKRFSANASSLFADQLGARQNLHHFSTAADGQPRATG